MIVDIIDEGDEQCAGYECEQRGVVDVQSRAGWVLGVQIRRTDIYCLDCARALRDALVEAVK